MESMIVVIKKVIECVNSQTRPSWEEEVEYKDLC